MLAAVRFTTSNSNGKVGNHSVKTTGQVKKFYYFGNCVCVADYNAKTFHLDNCGYGGYQSTTRTLNDYRRYFTSIGFKEV